MNKLYDNTHKQQEDDEYAAADYPQDQTESVTQAQEVPQSEAPAPQTYAAQPVYAEQPKPAQNDTSATTHAGNTASNIEFYDVEEKAQNEGLRITTTNGSRNRTMAKAVGNTFDKGRALLLTAIYVFVVALAELWSRCQTIYIYTLTRLINEVKVTVRTLFQVGYLTAEPVPLVGLLGSEEFLDGRQQGMAAFGDEGSELLGFRANGLHIEHVYAAHHIVNRVDHVVQILRQFNDILPFNGGDEGTAGRICRESYDICNTFGSVPVRNDSSSGCKG